jgi:hypothetical protein
MTATDARMELLRLTAELHDAHDVGLGSNAAYLGDLEADIADWRDAYVGLAVTEIATFRGQLSGPLMG